MAFFDELGKKITKTSQGAIQKTKDMTEIAKLNSSVNEEQRKINQVYMQIGKAYYESHMTQADAEFVYLFDNIVESMEKINECESRIQQLKGMTLCPSCGGENKPGAAFCCSCGAKITVADPNVSELHRPDKTVCTSCGNPLKPGAVFCTNCGKKVDICDSEAGNQPAEAFSENLSEDGAFTDTFAESSSKDDEFTTGFPEDSSEDGTFSNNSANGNIDNGFVDPHR